jgi:hypothetical protein
VSSHRDVAFSALPKTNKSSNIAPVVEADDKVKTALRCAMACFCLHISLHVRYAHRQTARYIMPLLALLTFRWHDCANKKIYFSIWQLYPDHTLWNRLILPGEHLLSQCYGASLQTVHLD